MHPHIQKETEVIQSGLQAHIQYKYISIHSVHAYVLHTDTTLEVSTCFMYNDFTFSFRHCIKL